MTTPISNPTPYQLVCSEGLYYTFLSEQNFYQRSLVLDYLCHSCYTRTAIAFAGDSTIRHLDADGDEIVEAVDPDDPSSSSTEQFENHMKQVALRQGAYLFLCSYA